MGDLLLNESTLSKPNEIIGYSRVNESDLSASYIVIGHAHSLRINPSDFTRNKLPVIAKELVSVEKLELCRDVTSSNLNLSFHNER